MAETEIDRLQHVVAACEAQIADQVLSALSECCRLTPVLQAQACQMAKDMIGRELLETVSLVKEVTYEPLTVLGLLIDLLSMRV